MSKLGSKLECIGNEQLRIDTLSKADYRAIISNGIGKRRPCSTTGCTMLIVRA